MITMLVPFAYDFAVLQTTAGKRVKQKWSSDDQI